MLGRFLLLSADNGDPVGFVFYAQRQSTQTPANPLWPYVDGDGNVYFAAGASSTYDGYQIIKFDSTGTVQWTANVENYGADPLINTRNYVSNGEYTYPFIVGADSSGDLYLATFANSTYASQYRLVVTKMSSSDGSLGYSKVYADTARTETEPIPMANMSLINSSGNFHIVGRYLSSVYGKLIQASTSDGTVQWVQDFGVYQAPTCLALDSSDNIYAGVNYREATVGERCGVAKFNSSGDRQWTKQYSWYSGGTTNNLDEILTYIAHDSVNGALYITTLVKTSVSGIIVYVNYLMKIDPSNGDLLWTKKLTGISDNYAEVVGLAVDSAGYPYVGFGYGSSAVGAIDILKLNSSGVLQDSMRVSFSGTTPDVSFIKMYMSGNDQIYLSGREDSSDLSVWLLSIPSSLNINGSNIHITSYADYVSFGTTTSTASSSTHYAYTSAFDQGFGTSTASGSITTADVTGYPTADNTMTLSYTEV